MALMMLDPENPYRYIQLRGPVVEVSEEHGRAHINLLAKRYHGEDEYGGPKDEQRIRYKIVPEHVQTMG